MAGKHGRKNAAQEPLTDAGRRHAQEGGDPTDKSWSRLTGEEKAAEFDASIEDAGGYAMRNFPPMPGGYGHGRGSNGRHS